MGGFGSTLGLMFEITADPEHAVAALEVFQEQIASSLGVGVKSFQQFQDASLAAAKDLAVIGGVVGGLGAGLAGLAEHAAEAGNQIYEASEKTGMTAEHLSAISALAKETGGSFETLTLALSRAGVNLQNALVEPGELTAKVLAKVMGGAQNLAKLGLEPMDDRIQTVLQHIFALHDAGEREQALNALMGRGWQQNVEVLEMLARQGYAPAIEKAKEFGLFFDAKSSADAHKFIIELHTMTADLSGMALALGKEVMPYAESFLAWLHTASADAEVCAIRFAALSLAPATFGGSLLLLKTAQDLETKSTQEQTDWLVNLQKQMAAAEEAAKKLAAAQAGAAGGAGDKGGSAAGGGSPGKFSPYGPAMPDWMKQTTVSIDGMNKGFVDAVQSIHLWEGMMERTVDELPLAVHNFQSLANVLGSDQLSAAAIHSATGGSAVSHAANAAKIAVDGLAASMENAGGKSGAFSQKMLQAAQSMVAMAKQAQDAADKGETVDPKQQVAGMVQIAAAAILTYKERAIVESVYYAAKSVAAFAAQDYWAGAEYALASGLFAEAAGTASKASGSAGGSGNTGGNQSTLGGGPGGGASGPGGGGGGGKGGSPTIIWHQYGPTGNMADFARTLAGVQNAMVNSGQIKVVATVSTSKGGNLT